MIGFQYARAKDVSDAVRQIAGDPNAKFVAGGTNLIDLMKMDVERPTKVIDITRLPLKQVENTPSGGLRIGALVRNTRPRLSLTGGGALPGSRQRDHGRRLATTAQHGIDRWQPLAAHALPLFLRYSDALQQTRAGQRLLRHRRPQSHARDPRQQ